VDVLDERVLRHDKVLTDLRFANQCCVVLNACDQPAALELCEQAELTEL